MHRRPHWQKVILRRVIALVTWALLPAGLGSSTFAQAPGEYQVKAAFLYKFTKFVDWPQEPGGDAPGSLVICVVGDDPFGDTLDKVVEGKSVNGQSIIVRRMKSIQNAQACRIAFISSSEKARFRLLLDFLKGSSVLTVGDTEGFAEMGGVINFTMEEDHVRFEINVDAAKRARLNISAKLLGLAKIVRTEHSG